MFNTVSVHKQNMQFNGAWGENRYNNICNNDQCYSFQSFWQCFTYFNLSCVSLTLFLQNRHTSKKIWAKHFLSLHCYMLQNTHTPFGTPAAFQFIVFLSMSLLFAAHFVKLCKHFFSHKQRRNAIESELGPLPLPNYDRHSMQAIIKSPVQNHF